MVKRSHPLTVIISTAGDGQGGLAWDLWQYSHKVASGEIEDPTFAPIIFAAPPEADWRDESAWHMANPAIAAGFCSLEELRINPKPNKGGSTVLAFFDCQSNGFMLQGCAFVRTPRHGLTVWPPKIDGPESARRSVAFADERLRQAMVRAAQCAYRALGGTDGEWMPYDDERSAENAAEAAERVRSRAIVANVASVAEDEGVRRFLGGAAS